MHDPKPETAQPDGARVAVTHTIEQCFDRAVRLSTHWLRLRPAPQTKARITAYSMKVHAEPHFLNWVRDPLENYLARLDLPEALTALKIDVEFIADLEPVNPFDFLTDPGAFEHPFDYPALLRRELAPCLKVQTPGKRLAGWIDEIGHGKMSTVERLSKVNGRVQTALGVVPTTSLRPADPEAVLARGSGSCWDLAWLLTMSLRHLGMAARLASGYRIQLAERPPARDTVAMHCWSEVYIPGAGWLGLDPFTGLFIDESYIPLACAPDPLRVVPLVGFREACGEEQLEHLRVRRLIPTAAPEAETQWADVRALGRLVEQDLDQQGLKPSVGTGLSLVSHIANGALEWNVAALGPDKRSAAEALLACLHARLAPTGVIHEGQTEWFAGDALPRWQLGCYFRRDGQPVWRDAMRLGLFSSNRRDRIAEQQDAQRFAQALAGALGIPSRHVVAAYEDPLNELLKAPASPEQTPSADQLADPEARRELAERLSQARGEPAGHVIPLRRDHTAECWASGAWAFRRKDLYLMPGDSPIGYRLPLGSLVHDPQAAREAQLERSPFEDRPPLPAPATRTAETHPPPEDPTTSPVDTTPRTALCVQPRGGRLHLFLPPVSHVEHYLELLAAAEAASEAVDLAVTFEGYAPPEDHRLGRIELEPDSGVLRVRLPELDRWDEQVDMLETVYEEAWRVGLAPERVTPDGRMVPTGGGGRLTIGGSQPADSPFLARPAILGALIGYWQRHPSLSYFFNGRSLGPSGFAARPDEGRDEAIYELSLGLDRLPESTAPWHTDRVLRHLLTDLAGDLTRAEIRMDELYSPDRAVKRLGRIQIGSFETPPDPRMAALQALLVLALLGRFARTEARVELERWGTALHDRFMLPDALWADLRSVIEDLNEAGYPFQLTWFEELFERRYPALGHVQIGEISLELRAAHEPWPLLAEQASTGGMARFIDMANERVQVKLSGLTPQRYALVCNGRRSPLRSTGTHGEYLAGVRYKVTNPPATLHPTIPAVEALIFDLIDTWSGRAIGGCTYIPARPLVWGPVDSPIWPAYPQPVAGDGAAPERPRRPPPPTLPPAPVSRSGGFLPHGTGLGPMASPPEAPSERRPYLLDLTQH